MVNIVAGFCSAKLALFTGHGCMRQTGVVAVYHRSGREISLLRGNTYNHDAPALVDMASSTALKALESLDRSLRKCSDHG